MITTYGLTLGLLVAVALGTVAVGDKAKGRRNTADGRVAVSAEDIHSLLVGMKVPEVTLTNLHGEPFVH